MKQWRSYTVIWSHCITLMRSHIASHIMKTFVISEDLKVHRKHGKYSVLVESQYQLHSRRLMLIRQGHGCRYKIVFYWLCQNAPWWLCAQRYRSPCAERQAISWSTTRWISWMQLSWERSAWNKMPLQVSEWPRLVVFWYKLPHVSK